MKKQNVVLGVLLVAVLVVGANFPRQGGTVVERVIEKVGASAGPDVFVHTRFFDGMTDGGGVYSSTTGATIAAGTVSSAIMKKNKVLRFGGPFSAAFTLTLPASTTMGDVLERPGTLALGLLRTPTMQPQRLPRSPQVQEWTCRNLTGRTWLLVSTTMRS